MSLNTYRTARLHTRYVAYKTVLRGRLLDSTGHKIFTFHGLNKKLEAEGWVVLTWLPWFLASLAQKKETKNSNSNSEKGGGEWRITNGPNWNGSHEVMYSLQTTELIRCVFLFRRVPNWPQPSVCLYAWDKSRLLNNSSYNLIFWVPYKICSPLSV
jgi:hypothetical protein